MGLRSLFVRLADHVTMTRIKYWGSASSSTGSAGGLPSRMVAIVHMLPKAACPNVVRVTPNPNARFALLPRIVLYYATQLRTLETLFCCELVGGRSLGKALREEFGSPDVCGNVTSQGGQRVRGMEDLIPNTFDCQAMLPNVHISGVFVGPSA